MIPEINTKYLRELGLVKGMVLSGINYEQKEYTRKNENFRDGRYWVRYKLNEYSSGIFYLTVEEFYSALRHLELHGYIILEKEDDLIWVSILKCES